MVTLYHFLAISVVAVVIVGLSRSVRMMNFFTVAYSLSVSVYALQVLVNEPLPVFLLNNNYLFLDSLAIYEIVVSGFVFFLAAVYAGGYVDALLKDGELAAENAKLFYITFNLLFISVILAFSSNNLAVLWVFAEITTVLSAVLVVLLNAKENIAAAIKYVFITSTAMLFSFIGLVILFAISKESIGTATLNWDLLFRNARGLSSPALLFPFAFIFIGFAAKSGIAPFHTWLPPAHAKASSDVSVLLSGSILNIGIYAIMRIAALTVKTPAGSFFSSFLLLCGIATVGVAAFSMAVRTNLKKLIAFSSIENMGFMLIGIAAGNVFWVLYHTLAHSLAKALLFFSTGIINRQYHSVKLDSIHDIFRLQPLAVFGLIVGGMAIIGVPFLPLFLSKLYILVSLGRESLVALLFVLLLSLIASSSFAWFIIKLVKNNGKKVEPYAAPLSMRIPIVLLVAVLAALGLYFPETLRLALDNIAAGVGSLG